MEEGARVEDAARRLADQSQPISTRLQLALDLRDSLDVADSADLPRLVELLFPILVEILRDGIPVFEDNSEHRLRLVAVDVLAQISSTGGHQLSGQLMPLCLQLLKTDNEDIGSACLRIIADLHRALRPRLEDMVEPLFEFLVDLFVALPATVQTRFSVPPRGSGSDAASRADDGATLDSAAPLSPPFAGGARPIAGSFQSFKLILETPLVLVLLFQFYPRTASAPAISTLFRHCMDTLALRASPEASATHPDDYASFISVQVKTLTFFAYLVRHHSAKVDSLQPPLKVIPPVLLHLLEVCPAASVQNRKELLVALRHVLSPEFHPFLVPYIERMLDERVLIGSGSRAHETLRPLMFNTLAESIHLVRDQLTFPQLEKAVVLFSANIHDASLPVATQSLSAKLLLTLIEFVVERASAPGSFSPGKETERLLLVSLLCTFVSKFSAIKTLQLASLSFSSNSIWQSQSVTSSSELLRRECRGLLKTLVPGLRTIVWGIGCCGRTYSTPSSAHPKTFVTAETPIFRRLFKSGLVCFCTHSIDSSPRETKDLLEHFAGVFTMLDNRSFGDIMQAHLPFLFDCLFVNDSMLAIPQHFLASSAVSSKFSELLLPFLSERLNEYNVPVSHGGLWPVHEPPTSAVLDLVRPVTRSFLPETQDSPAVNVKNGKAGQRPASSTDKFKVVLKLFKLLFNSVSMFPDCEFILVPHLAGILRACLHGALKSGAPLQNLVILRLLFRAVSAAHHDLLYAEFVPLQAELLEALTRIMRTTEGPAADVSVELCLTLPVRLSALLPFFHLLLPALMCALQSGPGERAAQGLRTLELFVDNLAKAFLDAALSPYHGALTVALKSHLRPPPYPHGSHALRLLGKLGGWARHVEQVGSEEVGPAMGLRMFQGIRSQGCTVLDSSADGELVEQRGLEIHFPLAGTSVLGIDHDSDSSVLTFDRYLDEARRILFSPSTEVAREVRGAAAVVVQACLCSLLRQEPPELSASAFLCVSEDRSKCDDSLHATARYRAQSRMAISLIESVIAAAAHRGDRIFPDSPATQIRRLPITIARDSSSSSSSPDCAVPKAPPPPSKDVSHALPCVFLEHLAAHFAVLCASAGSSAADSCGAGGGYIHPSAFLDAVCGSLFSPKESVWRASLRTFHFFISALFAIAGTARSDLVSDELPSSSVCLNVELVLLDILARLGDACVGEGPQSGAVAAIALLVGVQEDDWVRVHCIRLAEPLLAVLRDFPPHTTAQLRADCFHALSVILRISFVPVKESDSQMQDSGEVSGTAAKDTRAGDGGDAADASGAAPVGTGESSPLGLLFVGDCERVRIDLVVLVMGLSRAISSFPLRASRHCARKLLLQLSEQLSTSVSALILSSDDSLRSVAEPLFGASLKTQGPVDAEALLDALTFWLDVRPPLLTFANLQRLQGNAWPKLMQVLQDALLVCEAEVPLLVPGPHPGRAARAHVVAMQGMSALMPRCIALLSSAIRSGELYTPEHTMLRNRAIGVFFRALSVRSPVAVEKAKAGLRHVISNSRLPKDLLHSSLRPVLLSLADHHKLSGSLLRGLAQLLELLTGMFNTTLGDKLLEHIKEILDPRPATPDDGAVLANTPSPAGSSGVSSATSVSPAGAGMNQLSSSSGTYDAPQHSRSQPQPKQPASVASGISASGASQGAVPPPVGAAAVPFRAGAQRRSIAGAKGVLASVGGGASPNAGVSGAAEKAAAILNVFHLLPSAARKFLPQLVAVTLKLEESMPHDTLFRFRPALFKFLRVYPDDACSFFLSRDRLTDPVISSLFVYAIGTAQCTPICDELSKHPQLLIEACFSDSRIYSFGVGGGDESGGADADMQPATSTSAGGGSAQGLGAGRSPSDEMLDELRFQGVRIVRIVAKRRRGWISQPSSARLFQRICDVWASFHAQGCSGSDAAGGRSPAPGESASAGADGDAKMHPNAAYVAGVGASGAGPVKQVEEERLLLKIFVAHCREDRSNLSIPFQILPALGHVVSCDLAFVRRFYVVDLPLRYSVDQQQQLLARFLVLYTSENLSTAERILMLRYVATPVITHACKSRARARFRARDTQSRNLAEQESITSAAELAERDEKVEIDTQGVLSGDLIHRLVCDVLCERGESQAILAQPYSVEGSPRDEAFGDASVDGAEDREADAHVLLEKLRLRQLQFGCVLVHFVPELLSEHRKELVKFAWLSLKSLDLQVKYWSYMLLCHFVVAFETPPRIVLKVFVQLLRAYHPELRMQARSALSVLAPMLPTRLPSSDPLESRWIKWARRAVSEDGRTLSQQIHVWQLLAQFPSLFYVAREMFVPQIASSLDRIYNQHPSAAENRHLTVQLASLIIGWEEHRAALLSFNVEDDASESARRALIGNPACSRVAETVVHFLMRLAVSAEPVMQLFPVPSARVYPLGPVPGRPSSIHGPNPPHPCVRAPFPEPEASLQKSPTRLAHCAVKLLDRALLVWPDFSVRSSLVDALLRYSTTQRPAPLADVSGHGRMTTQHAPTRAEIASRGVPGSSGTAGAGSAVVGGLPSGVSGSNASLQGRVASAPPISPFVLAMLTVILKSHSSSFVSSNIQVFLRAFPPCFAADLEAQTLLLPHVSDFAGALVQHFPQDNMESSPLFLRLGELANENLLGVPAEGTQAVDPIMKPPVERGVPQVNRGQGRLSVVALTILEAMCGRDPRVLDRFVPALVRAFQHAVQEFSLSEYAARAAHGAGRRGPVARLLVQANAVASRLGAGGDGSAARADVGSAGGALQAAVSVDAAKRAAGDAHLEVNALLQCSRLIAVRIRALGVHKQPYFSALLIFIESCEFPEALLEIAHLLRRWIEAGHEDAERTLNEAAAVTSLGPMDVDEPAVATDAADAGVAVDESTESGSRHVSDEDSGPILSPRDTIRFLLKMAGFERFGDSDLVPAVLRLVYDQYILLLHEAQTNPSAVSLLSKLQPAVMIGLRAPFEYVRRQCFSLLQAGVEDTVAGKLLFMFQMQDWECIADSFWLSHCLKLLLYSAPRWAPALRPAESFIFPKLCSKPFGTGLPAHVAADQPQCVNSYLKVRRTVVQLHEMMWRHTSLGSIVDPLATLSVLSPRVASALWISLFPLAWASLSGTEKPAVSSALSSLLSKEYLSVQHDQLPNVGGTLLAGVAACSMEDSPFVPAALVRYAARNYRAWDVGLVLLERHARVADSAAELHSRGSKVKDELAMDLGPTSRSVLDLSFLDVLGSVYWSMGELDHYFALWRRRAVLSDTRTGLALMQFGRHGAAQDILVGAMHKLRTGSATGKPAIPAELTNAEVAVVENSWLQSALELNQWDILSAFAQQAQHPQLILDCAWNNKDWETIKRLLTSGELAPEDTAAMRLYAMCIAVEEKRFAEVEGIAQVASRALLRKYLHLPHMSAADDSEGLCKGVFVPWCWCRECCSSIRSDPLDRWDEVESHSVLQVLQTSQQIVEVQESASMLSMLQQATIQSGRVVGKPLQAGIVVPAARVAEVRSMLSTWRERLPDRAESISIWHLVFRWRYNVFQALNQALGRQPLSDGRIAPNTGLFQIGHHETASTLSTFAHAARQHGLVDVCLASLGRIYTLPSIEIHDAFVKLREQVKCYFQLPQYPNAHRTGLDIINSTNLDYFGPLHKAQFFRLKGEFLASMQLFQDAHKAFSTALSVYDQLPAGWLRWGEFCAMQYTSGLLTMGEQAVGCYLQALRLGIARYKVVPRLLWLFELRPLSQTQPRLAGSSSAKASFQATMTDMIQTALDACDSISPGVWLPWIGSVIVALDRPEASFAAHVLTRVAAQHPQSVYWPLRTVLLQLRYRLGVQNGVICTLKEIPRPPTRVAVHQQAASRTAPDAGSDRAGPEGAVGPSAPQHGVAGSSKPGGAHAGALEKDGGDAQSAHHTAQSVRAAAPLVVLNASQVQSLQTALRHSEQIMGILWSTHMTLSLSFELLLEAIDAALLPSYSELLVSALSSLLCSIHSRGADSSKDDLNSTERATALLRSFHASWVNQLRIPDYRAGKHRTRLGVLLQFGGLSDSVKQEPIERFASNIVAQAREFDRNMFAYLFLGGTRPPNAQELLSERPFAALVPASASEGHLFLEEVTALLVAWLSVAEARVQKAFDGGELAVQSRLHDGEIDKVVMDGAMDNPVRLLARCRMADFDWALCRLHRSCIELDVPLSLGPQAFSASHVAGGSRPKIRLSNLRVGILRGFPDAHRLLHVVGSDGRYYPFAVQRCLDVSGFGPGESEVLNLSSAINLHLSKSIESRRRGLHLNIFSMASVSPHCRLVSHAAGSVSLDRLLAHVASRAGKHSARHGTWTAAVQFENLVAKTGGGCGLDLPVAFAAVQSRFLPPSALHSFFVSMSPQPRSLFAMRKTIASNLALFSAVGFFLGIGERNARNIFLDFRTGSVLHLRFSPRNPAPSEGDSMCTLSCSDPVPFRLTPNLAHFLSPWCIDGPFESALSSTAVALMRRKDVLADSVALYLRSECCFAWVPETQGGVASVHCLAERVAPAVAEVMNRISVLVPSCTPGIVTVRAGELVAAASNSQNLSRMDPSWQPWF